MKQCSFLLIFCLFSTLFAFDGEYPEYRFQFQVGLTPKDASECITAMVSFYVEGPDNQRYSSKPVTLIAADPSEPTIKTYTLDLPPIVEDLGEYRMGMDLLHVNGKPSLEDEKNFVRAMVVSPEKVPVFERRFYDFEMRTQKAFAEGVWKNGESPTAMVQEPFFAAYEENMIEMLEMEDPFSMEACKEDYFRTYLPESRVPKCWK